MRRWSSLMMVVVAVLIASFGVAAAAPQLTVTSPQAGASIDGTDVTVTFEAREFSIVPSTIPLDEAGKHPEVNRDGEGHVHFMLDLMPVIVWESSAPYTMRDVPPGEHVLTVELVNNDHSPLSPPVVQQMSFRSNSDQMLGKTGGGSTPSNGTELMLTMLVGTAILCAGVYLRRRAA